MHHYVLVRPRKFAWICTLAPLAPGITRSSKSQVVRVGFGLLQSLAQVILGTSGRIRMHDAIGGAKSDHVGSGLRERKEMEREVSFTVPPGHEGALSGMVKTEIERERGERGIGEGLP